MDDAPSTKRIVKLVFLRKPDASREILHHLKVLPGTLHGSDGSTKFMEDRETVFSKTRCGNKERNKKLQCFCAVSGKRKRTQRQEAVTCVKHR